MNEKPKSFWKKSWTGPRAFLFWLLIVSMAAFLMAVLIAIGTSVKTTLFDRHLTLNLAAFYNNYKNMQVFLMVPEGRIAVNLLTNAKAVIPPNMTAVRLRARQGRGFAWLNKFRR